MSYTSDTWQIPRPLTMAWWNFFADYQPPARSPVPPRRAPQGAAERTAELLPPPPPLPLCAGRPGRPAPAARPPGPASAGR